jgi:UDP-4-amino-4,6-dideoxy-N-acetyl-beta-L-altrosamine transaminase
MKFIGYGQQWIDDEDRKAVQDVLNGSFLTQGPNVKAFEDAVCRYTGAKYAVAVSNGTAALHLAVLVLEIEAGGEGITSANTFMASSNALLYSRLIPVFGDINLSNYCSEADQLKERVSKKTKLMIPVHFSGYVCDMKSISQLARERNCFIIEDAAHAIGGQYQNGKRVGSCGDSDCTIFSFHPVKTITSGEGGMITTNNADLYKKLCMLRNHGIERDEDAFINKKDSGPWYHEMQMLGFNYRMTDVQAALGLSQLKKIDRFVQRRRDIVRQYNTAFKDVEWLATQQFSERDFKSSAHHLYILRIDFNALGKTRRAVMEYLKSKNVGTQVHYIPVYRQPYYQKHYGLDPKDYPRMEQYYQEALTIPLFPKMTDDDVQYVIDQIKGIKDGP